MSLSAQTYAELERVRQGLPSQLFDRMLDDSRLTGKTFDRLIAELLDSGDPEFYAEYVALEDELAHAESAYEVARDNVERALAHIKRGDLGTAIDYLERV
jgi:hypothetical protein